MRLLGRYVRSVCAEEPKWRNGRRAGLKIRSPQGGVGSSPTFGTIQRKDLRRFLRNGFQRCKSHFTKFHKNRSPNEKSRVIGVIALLSLSWLIGPFDGDDSAGMAPSGD